jgi:amidophosphoribosyltransferase
VRASIGADSLGYISLEGMVEATQQRADRLCSACFTGTYPIRLPDATQLGKHSLEQQTLPLETDAGALALSGRAPRGAAAGHLAAGVHRDAEGVATGLSGGAHDALTRP